MLRLTPGDHPEVQAEATVVWLRDGEDKSYPPGMGLQFESLDAETLGRLRRIISQQQKNPVKAVWAG